MMIMTLMKSGGSGKIPGKCANPVCGKDVFEHTSTLDDAYNVWAGKCPYCGAINLLSTHFGLRGYSSQKMELVLPYIEEIEDERNDLPKDIPNAGHFGAPPTMHGSPLGELCHKLTAKAKDD